MTDPSHSYVVRTAEGGWRVAGSRVSLDSVVYAFVEGASAEEIVAQFPSLTLEQAYGAIAFCLRNRDEIDRYLTQQDARWEQLRQESIGRDDPLMKRLRGMKAAEQVKTPKLG